MSKDKSHTEKTGAAKTAIGFEYQFYVFLSKLLRLQVGETIGLEVKDDIHTELKNNFQILIQVKHTLKNDKDGSPVKLTNLDPSLWKTVSNWVKVVTDPIEKRNTIQSQKEFLSKTTFLLTTNKSLANENILAELINEAGGSSKNVSSMRKKLKDLKEQTTDSTIKSQISDLLNLKTEILSIFLNKIEFEDDNRLPIEDCKNAIKEKLLPLNRIDLAFDQICAQVRHDNYITIKNGDVIQISFDDFHLKYRALFDKIRSDKLVIRKFEDKLPEDLLTQTFIKQLIDINYLSKSNNEKIANYTRKKLHLINNLLSWENNGEICELEKNELNTDAIGQWQNHFDYLHKEGASEKEINESAAAILYELLKLKLTLADTVLNIELSNGKYFELSDQPVLGWHKNWEIKHK